MAALLLRIGQTDLLGAPGLAVMTHGVSLNIANVFSAAGGGDPMPFEDTSAAAPEVV